MGAGCTQLEVQREGGRLHGCLIIGHGPSVVNRGLGSWIDQQTVIRLKWAERPNPVDWGTRTDYVVASSPSFWTDKKKDRFPDAELWVLERHKKIARGKWRIAREDWLDHFLLFGPSYPKPSTGLKAVFCAIEFLEPTEIMLLGFDRVLHPDVPTSKWWHEPGKYSYCHDAHAEHRCLMSLGVKITEV